jgi:membrane protein implicated in regulation of membrane protease activity
MKLAEPGHRKGFIVWNALGILDLVVAVTTGTTSRLMHPHGLAAEAMTVLPLSIVPTFLVPLFAILHIIAIAQARRWREVEGARNRQHVPASAT